MIMDNLWFRDMTNGDLDEVVRLEALIFPDAWPESSFKEMLADKDWGALVAETDGRIVGYACYLVVVDEAHVANIAVHPDYRRKSVAKRLLDRILGIARDESCVQIFLEVRPSNTAARTFYEHAGFVELYRRPGYYRQPREDALVMVMPLIPDRDDG
jgi:[ribosomal protein S18]-alanine N-acetyltransferase